MLTRDKVESYGTCVSLRNFKQLTLKQTSFTFFILCGNYYTRYLNDFDYFTCVIQGKLNNIYLLSNFFTYSYILNILSCIMRYNLIIESSEYS